MAFDGDFREQFNDKLHGGNGCWQALSDLYREKYSSPHLRLIQARKYTTNIALLRTSPYHWRYLLFALSPLP